MTQRCLPCCRITWYRPAVAPYGTPKLLGVAESKGGILALGNATGNLTRSALPPPLHLFPTTGLGHNSASSEKEFLAVASNTRGRCKLEDVRKVLTGLASCQSFGFGLSLGLGLGGNDQQALDLD